MRVLLSWCAASTKPCLAEAWLCSQIADGTVFFLDSHHVLQSYIKDIVSDQSLYKVVPLFTATSLAVPN